MNETQFALVWRTGLVCAAVTFTGCAQTAWHAAQLPGLSMASNRMNEDALLRSFRGQPVDELKRNIRDGDYRFRGLNNVDTHREWVPGLRSGEFNPYHVEYLITGNAEKWTPVAERYFNVYNHLLLPELRNAKLDTYGYRVP
jgi:hypothetical protein